MSVTETAAATVHVVFKTHLDIGFTDTAENVVRRYMESFIPRALDLAEKQRREGSADRFIWTTGSWLIHEFLEKSPPGMRKRMEEAILAGEITWHALPFTTHTELMDPDLFRAGLSLSGRLDERFGKKTIAAKMTDVPGHCRAVIPLLAEAGVRLLHIGINPAARPAALPPLFRWQSPGGSKVIVNYVSGYGRDTEWEGMKDHLYLAHTEDNLGPPSEEELAGNFSDLRQKYGNCRVTASTLDRYAEKLIPFARDLPVITEEIGDTWIYGAGSDPAKTAAFRQLGRLRNRWRKEGYSLRAPEIDAFSRSLLMIPEHTWGLDEKTHLPDNRHYSRKDFEAARKAADRRSPWAAMEQSWQEQRAYLEEGVTGLTDSRMRSEAVEALKEILPRRPSLKGFSRTTPPTDRDMGGLTVSFCPGSGALSALRDRTTGKDWISPGGRIGLFRYESFSAGCYETYMNRYNGEMKGKENWVVQDNSKPGLEQLENLEHRFYRPEEPEFFLKEDIVHTLILVKARMPRVAVEEFGAPEEIITLYRFCRASRILETELYWFGKAASRLPEASWFTFHLNPGSREYWFLDKMGEEISPFDVIRGGNRALHAVESGITYRGTDGPLTIESLDAPLVSPGRPRILEADTDQPDLSEGFHFNLHNNLWGTNFPMWYEDDGFFRFRLIFS